MMTKVFFQTRDSTSMIFDIHACLSDPEVSRPTDRPFGGHHVQTQHSESEGTLPTGQPFCGHYVKSQDADVEDGWHYVKSQDADAEEPTLPTDHAFTGHHGRSRADEE